jgi:hypothetical protein
VILHPPFIITPRLLPGVKIGKGFISLERDVTTNDNRDRFRWYVDIDGKEYTDNDLKSGVGGCSFQEAFAALFSFLSAAAESYSYRQQTGTTGENEDLFPNSVVEWAYQHNSEIEILGCALEESKSELIEE